MMSNEAALGTTLDVGTFIAVVLDNDDDDDDDEDVVDDDDKEFSVDAGAATAF